MRALGAVLAGGKARRFGSDKAIALVDGVRLIDRVASALAAQSEAVIVCGRSDDAYRCIADHPEPGLGPLGGLNAALLYARQNGFDAVLSAPCDVPDLPLDLARQLSGESAAIAEDQPVVGLWPVELAPPLDRFVQEGGRALYGWAEHCGARRIALDPPIGNVNRPEDLKNLG
jgi:molybdopterin-guanine dinucleotide biosynthesis protein A